MAATKGTENSSTNPLVGANGEGQLKRGDVQMAGLRVKNSPYVTGKLMNLVAQFGSPERRHKPAPGAH
jgi:hypothetical protein